MNTFMYLRLDVGSIATYFRNYAMICIAGLDYPTLPFVLCLEHGESSIMYCIDDIVTLT